MLEFSKNLAFLVLLARLLQFSPRIIYYLARFGKTFPKILQILSDRLIKACSLYDFSHFFRPGYANELTIVKSSVLMEMTELDQDVWQSKFTFRALFSPHNISKQFFGYNFCYNGLFLAMLFKILLKSKKLSEIFSLSIQISI